MSWGLGSSEFRVLKGKGVLVFGVYGLEFRAV